MLQVLCYIPKEYQFLILCFSVIFSNFYLNYLSYIYYLVFLNMFTLCNTSIYWLISLPRQYSDSDMKMMEIFRENLCHTM